ncbi:hypothetical protein F4861DRAFT_548851 [Xylaria intraflava]|nr:hypothetical protein F4861DRAFT_548851 [Xylaria intraflava]
MPRKVRQAADAAQNRQNQQRSRARRKAYLADLEAQLRELQDGGVRATLEMQRAAREVAWVNARLVELLAAKGVGRGEVEAFLRQAGEGSGSGFRETSLSCGRALEGLLSEGGGTPVCPRADGRDEGLDVGTSAGGPVDHDDSRNVGLDVGNSDDGPRIQVCDGGSGTLGLRPDAAGGSRALITSCDDAANIIADFQGHGDVLRARNALKCGDATDCHVKNTRLFQLMDEAGLRQDDDARRRFGNAVWTWAVKYKPLYDGVDATEYGHPYDHQHREAITV